MTFDEALEVVGAAWDEENGWYTDSEGCAHDPDFPEDSVLSLVHGGVFGMCTCGTPERTAKLVLEGLRCMPMYEGDNSERLKSLFGDATDFFLYWADKEHLTEHGISIGGCWITQKGQAVITLLEKAV